MKTILAALTTLLLASPFALPQLSEQAQQSPSRRQTPARVVSVPQSASARFAQLGFVVIPGPAGSQVLADYYQRLEQRR